MGYDIELTYHERLPDGSYDKENEKVIKKRVGKIEEEISYEKLAATIGLSFMRRDIWIVRVKIFEYSRKEISFKESKDGIVINNKKYRFKDCSFNPEEVIEEHPVHKPTLQSTELVTYANNQSNGPNVNLADLQLLKRKPIRYEQFQPDPAFVDLQSAKRLFFTIGEKYPIYAEKPAGSDPRLGMNYTTIDNKGNRQVLNDKYFVLPSNLIGEQFNNKTDLELDFGGDGGFGGAMPKLR